MINDFPTVLAEGESLFLVMTLVFLCVAAVMAFAIMRVGAIWLQALMSGVPIRIFDILAMRFRRVDPKVVLFALIQARHAGVPLDLHDAERAYLQGADLEKIVLALIESRRRDLGLSFEDLVAADLSQRLEDLLRR
jgi:uncharacterized protein YqfA (UPF0365 family)